MPISAFGWRDGSTPYINAANLESMLGVAGSYVDRLGTNTVCSAYRAAAWTPSAGSGQVMLDTKAFDPGNNFNISTSKYTVPSTGYYQVNGVVGTNLSNNANVYYLTSIYVGGTEAIRGEQIITAGGLGGYANCLPVSGILSLTATNVVQLQFYGDGVSAGQAGQAVTNMSIARIG